MVDAAPLIMSLGRFRTLGPRVNRLHLDVKRPSDHETVKSISDRSAAIGLS